MLNKPSLQRQMGCGNCDTIINGTTSPVLQATIASGSMAQEMKYNYPTADSSLSAVLTYTQMEADWAARDTPTKAITTFNIYDQWGNRTIAFRIPASSMML